MSSFLTAIERDRFAAWLEREAASDEGIARQMEVVPGSAILPEVIKRYRMEAAAARIVARRLRATEDVTL